MLLIAAPALADDPAPKHKDTQSDSFILIEPMYTTVVDAGRANGMLLVAIGLDIPDPVLRGQATLGLPVLRDAYVRSLMS